MREWQQSSTFLGWVVQKPVNPTSGLKKLIQEDLTENLTKKLQN